VGNVPTADGTYHTIGQGAVQVIDHNGSRVATWTDPVFLDGPWDLTIDDHGSWAYVFVSNVLNGSVTRLYVTVDSQTLGVQSQTTIASGYTHRPNPAALVLGPTGLAYDAGSDTLLTSPRRDRNAIYAVPQARHPHEHAAVRGTEIFQRSIAGPPRAALRAERRPAGRQRDAVLANPCTPARSWRSPHRARS